MGAEEFVGQAGRVRKDWESNQDVMEVGASREENHFPSLLRPFSCENVIAVGD